MNDGGSLKFVVCDLSSAPKQVPQFFFAFFAPLREPPLKPVTF